MKFITYLFIVFLFIQTSNAQEEKKSDDWKFSGLAHIIGQIDGKDFAMDTHPLYNTTMKFRFGVEKTLFDVLTFKVDLQDSRIMGTGYVENTHNTDILQGYVEFDKVLSDNLAVQVGRFQMHYNDERYIGRSLWHYNERAFDGVRLKYHTESFNLDYFHIQHTSSTDYMLKVMPSNYPYPEEDYDGYGMYGLWSNTKLNENQSVDLFAFLEHNGKKSNDKDPDLNRYTAGACYDGKFNDLSASADFAYQFGTQSASDIAAYNVAVDLNYKLKKANINLGTNIISGTDPEGDEFGVFSNYPASKHKFLGLMDYFLVTTKGTGNLGVNDFYLGMSLGGMKIGKPFGQNKSNLKAMLTFHHFMANQTPSSDETVFGQEIDFVLKYDITKGAFLQVGGGLFLPGDLMKTLWTTSSGHVREDMSFWAFTMLLVKLN